MRITIEIPDEIGARLLAVAAHRGLKGYSEVVVEALQKYLDEEESRSSQTELLARIKGSWSPQEANELRQEIEKARRRWTLSSE